MFEATGWSLEEEGKDNAKFDMLMPSVVKPPKTCDLILDEGQYPHEVGKILIQLVLDKKLGFETIRHCIDFNESARKSIFRLFPIISISQNFFLIFFLTLEKIGIDKKVICYHNISN